MVFLDLQKAIACIRKAFQEMKPASEGSFEDLVAEVLTYITGLRFRTSKSGTQGGIDGAYISNDLVVVFEAKRVKRLDKRGLYIKIVDLQENPRTPDVYILVSLVELDTQTFTVINEELRDKGIEFICLDWSRNDVLCELVAVLSWSREVLIVFNERHGAFDALMDDVLEAAQIVRDEENSFGLVEGLKDKILNSIVSMRGLAKALNEFVETLFSKIDVSKYYLGQELVPLSKDIKYYCRSEESKLVDILKEGNAKGIAILGDEGVGKSWVFGRAWNLSGALRLKKIFLASKHNELSNVPNMT